LKRIPLCLALAAAFFLSLGNPAGAVPIDTINGATQLNVTSFATLEGLGVTVAPGGTAEVVSIPALPSPIVFYDVTSVDTDLRRINQIFHEGSILDLTTSQTVRLSDFVINATEGGVFADVSFDSTIIPLARIFDITADCTVEVPCFGLDGTLTVEGVELTLSDAAGQLLVDELGIDNLAGVAAAVATSSFTPVPEPGTVFLGMTGLVMLGAVSRRRVRRTSES
jgi:hypothetical protein